MPTRSTIAGHIHPAALLHGPQGERLRLPCFHFAPSVATLPAFGRLTGTHAIRTRTDDRLLGGEVLQLQ
jgi:metallophosphoesterase superfamily enzyme